MKKFLTLFLMLSLSTAMFAICNEDTTTVIPLRIITSTPGSGDDPVPDHPNPHAPIFIRTVYVTLISDFISIDTSYFTEDYITLTISDDVYEIIYINENIQNTNSVTQIDISSIPVGAYIISIKDGDDEYIGEFEVF